MATDEHILIVGVNWIGDAIMSMPAVQAFHRRFPQARFTLLVKPALRPLWALHAVPQEVLILESGLGGTIRTVERLRSATRFDRAFILPHSFRSALIPRLAGVPERIGMPGHYRDFLLTDVRPPRRGPDRGHQVFEYYDVFLPEDRSAAWEPPQLIAPDLPDGPIREWMTPADKRPYICFMPGAARGPSKQWPADHFIELGRSLVTSHDYRIAVLGAPAETELCELVASGIGAAARNWAGATSFNEWVALIAQSSLAVVNDSGGMHVAAALDVPLVALYGITDPATTGPLTTRATILQKANRRHRDVPRDSVEARAALASISAGEVHEACSYWLNK